MAEDPLADQSAKLLRALDFAAEAAALREEHEERFRALIASLFEVVDSFDRLLVDAGGGGEAWRGTVKRIAGQLERALAQAGVTEIQCRSGDVADPRRHQIVDVKTMHGVDDDTIVDVLSRGWEWNGKPVRLPRVVVARNPKETRP